MVARIAAPLGLILALLVPVGSASGSVGVLNRDTGPNGARLASATVFGADLAATPQQEYNCAQNAASHGRPASSCMVSYIGTYPNSMSPSGSGTVTTIRVRAGSVGGPMRVNVIRFLFQQTGDPAHPLTAGPFLEVYGPQFTATPNSVNTVSVNLPMTVTGTPDPSDTTTIQVIDALALELLDPNTTVPTFPSPGVLSYPSIPGPTSLGVPAPSPNTLPTFPGVGAGVLMNADFTAASQGVGPDPGGPAPGSTAPSLTLPTKPLPVRKGSVRVPVTCAGAQCDGVLTLGPRVSAAAKKAKVYGKKEFAVAAGSSKTVKVSLTKAGRKAVRGHKKLPVTAKARFATGQTQAIPLTLKR